MGGKSSGSQSVENRPWEAAIPFLVGGGQDMAKFLPKELKGVDTSYIKGLFPEAAKLYNQSGVSSDLSSLLDFQKNTLKNRVGQNNDVIQGAYDIATSGQLDPKLIKPNAISGQMVGSTNVTPGTVQAAAVDPTQARASQGVLDPTQALQQVLSGQVNNSVLDPQIQNIITQVNRNTGENLLPQIRSGALQTGNYGGSRQGIAEGLALSRAQADIAQGLAPLVGQTYENAQGRMASLANILNEQAVNTATGNVNRGFAADVGNVDRQFNADVGNADRQAKIDLSNAMLDLQAQSQNAQNDFQYNAQNMQSLQQILNNKLSALNVLGQGQNYQDLTFQQAYDLLDIPRNRELDALNNYAGIVQPGAMLGGQQTGITQAPRNPLSAALGGGIAGSMLFAEGGALAGVGSIGGPAGAAIGAGLGLLTQLF